MNDVVDIRVVADGDAELPPFTNPDQRTRDGAV